MIVVGFAVVHRVRLGKQARRANLTRMGDDSGPVAAAPGARGPARRHDHAARTPRGAGRRSPPRPGIRRIHFVAWRDLDDPEAGGSELHAHKIASLLGRGRARRHLPHLGRAGRARPR